MDFFEVIEKRRSVRRYTSKTVPDEVIQKALAAALKAPNSSNMQPWEFYWVKSSEKKAALVNACLFQGTAKTANHLVVAVARVDTWKRNRDLIIQKMEPISKDLKNYYYRIIPFLYTQDPFGILGVLKWLVLNITGLFRPIFRGPAFKKDLFEVVTKTTALACENFMLAIVAQGYGCCPMEGFDECRVKRILSLGRESHVVMIVSVGETDPSGVFGPQIRVDSKIIVHEI
jgi:nitroreductase